MLSAKGTPNTQKMLREIKNVQKAAYGLSRIHRGFIARW
jgi:hypothetical protein